MRGALVVALVVGALGGIIPAHAGSTTSWRRWSPGSWDHPRVCGEHMYATPAENLHLGSSPRMRGAPEPDLNLLLRVGIIPAYAGSTSRPRPSTAITRDHPRVCGEHFRTCIAPREREGSSPRMRGALAELQVVQHRVGIIPAYAGSTLAHRIVYAGIRDHPRVCGEHSSSAR